MPSEGPQLPLLDPAAIETLRKIAGDQASGFVAEMAQLFLVETTRSLLDLREGCKRGDWTVVSRVAHSVKSSAATLGLMRLSEACRNLELDIEAASSTSATPTLAASVIEQFEHAVPALNALSSAKPSRLRSPDKLARRCGTPKSSASGRSSSGSRTAAM